MPTRRPPVPPDAVPLEIAGSVELPHDNGGHWALTTLIPGRNAFVAQYWPFEIPMPAPDFQIRLALFDVTTGSLTEFAVLAPGAATPGIVSDGRFIVWTEGVRGSLNPRGWKMFAFDLETNEKWEIARDSEVEFSRPGVQLATVPYLSAQSGRLAYSLLTADASGQPVYELRIVELESRTSTTILGPLNSRDFSIYGPSLYGDNIVWTLSVWQENEVKVRALWKMHLPNGQPEVLESGWVGFQPVLNRENVVYWLYTGQQDEGVINVMNIETRKKTQLWEYDSALFPEISGRFVYWIVPNNGTGVLVNAASGGKMKFGGPHVLQVAIEDGRIYWSWGSGETDSPQYLQWADLPEH